jgi:hypothetical protein
MNIQDKIEEIRKKPENIRRRYVWGWTAFSMIFIIAIWFISLENQNSGQGGPILGPEQVSTLKELGDQKDAIKDNAQKMKQTFDQMKEQQQGNPPSAASDVPMEQSANGSPIPDDTMPDDQIPAGIEGFVGQ